MKASEKEALVHECLVKNYEKYYTRIPVPKTKRTFNTDRIRIRSASGRR